MELPGNMAQMLEQAQKMQQDIARLKEEAESKEAEASAGGGMVTARVNGRGELLAIKIEKDVIDPNENEMLQDLVIAAVNEASRKSKDLVKEEISKITGGIPIPGLQNLFS